MPPLRIERQIAMLLRSSASSSRSSCEIRLWGNRELRSSNDPVSRRCDSRSVACLQAKVKVSRFALGRKHLDDLARHI
jgi:hypothetical protein